MLEAKRADLDATFASQLASTDATLQKLAAAGQLDEAVAVATAATGDMGAALLKAWGSFFGELFVRFRDGYDIAVVPDDPECGCSVASDVYRGSWCVRQAHLPRLSHLLSLFLCILFKNKNRLLALFSSVLRLFFPCRVGTIASSRRPATTCSSQTRPSPSRPRPRAWPRRTRRRPRPRASSSSRGSSRSQQ